MRPHFFYFDLGNVLLYFDHDLAFRRMAKIAGVTPKQMRTAVMDTELQIAYETGHISGSEFVDRIAQHLDKPLDVESILEAAADMFIANTHILPVLERVKELRIPWDCFRIHAKLIGNGSCIRDTRKLSIGFLR